MSEEGEKLAAMAESAARDIRARVIPGLPDLLVALAAWVRRVEEGDHGAC